MRFVWIVLLLLGSAAAQNLPDAPMPQHSHTIALPRTPKQFISTGRKIQNFQIAIPHTPFSFQPDLDDFNSDPFHRNPTFHPLGHIRGTKSIWFNIRF